MTKRQRKPTVMIGKTASNMKSFLVRDSRAKSGYSLWFCRGEGKCPMGPVHQRLAKQKCSDCVPGIENETLEQLQERMNKGNA